MFLLSFAGFFFFFLEFVRVLEGQYISMHFNFNF